MSESEEQDVLIPARFNERLIAYIIDAIPFMGGYTLTALFGLRFLGGAQALSRAALIWTALYVVYHFIGNLRGGTPGKKLMGLRVIALDGKNPGPGRALIRAVGHLVSSPFFDFGFLVALAHPENRALHDLMAGTAVIEPEPKHPAEATLLFSAAALTLAVMYGSVFYLHLFRPTPYDLEMVEKARGGLQVLAQIEEVYKQQHNSYSDQLADLAAASGDADQFRDAMLELFNPHEFKIVAGNSRYRISAAAKDRRGTRVVIEGPR